MLNREEKTNAGKEKAEEERQRLVRKRHKKLVEIPGRTIRCERQGFIDPNRSKGRIRIGFF